jgi:uncharacterized Zn-finger protein
MAPSLNTDGWEQSPSHSPDSIPQSTPISFQSHTLAFSPETTPVASNQALLVFDDHNQVTSPTKPSGILGRRTSRRPNPVAVPNLTKKARGRAVPTKDTLLKPGSGRAYACPVEDCRKVFTRSEHLKRHTRSIHTNEKREYPALKSLAERSKCLVR